MPTLDFDGTFDGWRAAARGALAAGLGPDGIVWRAAGDAQELLALDRAVPIARPAPPREPTQRTQVPRRFLAVAAIVACHRDPERWATLYRVLWRQTRGGEPHLLAVAVDPDVLHLTRMAKAVNREVHKLHAFVRFRLVRAADDTEEYVAWFEPEHDVVERAAALFVRRFANMRWAILTPRMAVRWNGSSLAIGPGVPRADAPSGDALEDLWRTYYAHIFNPARVKLQAMRAEMPKRYWRNLPEAPLIAPMVRDAPARVRRMVEAAATPRTGRLRAAPTLADGHPALATADVSPDPDPTPRAAPGGVERTVGDAVLPFHVGDLAVYVGTTGWDDGEHAARSDAGATPHATPGAGAAARLGAYASHHPLAVVESTRHRVLAPALATLWASRAPHGFLFDVHAHSAMLGGSLHPHRLPRTIRDLLPPSLAGAERVDGTLVTERVRDAIWARFTAAADVLAAHGVLGAILLRISRGVTPTAAGAERVTVWLRRLDRWPVAVEFAHPGWTEAAIVGRTTRLLARGGATRILAASELADGGPRSVPIAGPLAVVRGAAGAVRRLAPELGPNVRRVHAIGD